MTSRFASTLSTSVPIGWPLPDAVGCHIKLSAIKEIRPVRTGVFPSYLRQFCSLLLAIG